MANPTGDDSLTGYYTVVQVDTTGEGEGKIKRFTPIVIDGATARHILTIIETLTGQRPLDPDIVTPPQPPPADAPPTFRVQCALGTGLSIQDTPGGRALARLPYLAIADGIERRDVGADTWARIRYAGVVGWVMVTQGGRYTRCRVMGVT